MKLNEKLKELRQERGLTLKQLSNALEITLSAYANYEQGIRQPSLEIIKRICNFYGITADYLIGRED